MARPKRFIESVFVLNKQYNYPTSYLVVGEVHLVIQVGKKVRKANFSRQILPQAEDSIRKHSDSLVESLPSCVCRHPRYSEPLEKHPHIIVLWGAE
jgi:hypothetical protein